MRDLDFKNFKICIGWERAGIIFFRGGYHAYWIRYSKGMKWQGGFGGKMVNLWCLPRPEVCDLRPLVKVGIIKEGDVNGRPIR